MKNITLNKNIRRSITGSLGRFLSIFSLMFLGVFVFIGLKVSGPDMRTTAEHFFKAQHLADVTVLSTYGLDASDQKIIEASNDLEVAEFGYFQDALIKDTTTSIRVFSEPETLSTYELISGKMPGKEDEIALDFLHNENYELGDEIVFNEPDKITNQLKNHSFKIVGFIKSSEFLDKNDYGMTTIGSGQLNGYAVVKPSLFDSEVYSIARLAFRPMHDISPYDDAFTELSEKYQTQVENDLENQPEKRLNSIVAQAKTEIDENRAKLNDENAKVQAQQEILDLQKSQLTAAGLSMPAEILNAQDELNTAKQTINENLTKIKEEENELNNLELPVYSINDRSLGNPGYQIFLDNSTRIDILSNVFPVVLFSIAVFVCLTTMTRFVEEERSNIGLLKALGYSNRQIRRKFIIYGLVSGGLGTLGGLIMGHTFLPNAVFTAYTSSSTISNLILNFSLGYSLLAFVISIACTAIPAYLVVQNELKSVPASLFLSKPPKAGSRILLEKISFVWGRMPFTYKVTARNLFRYKQRMLMTIVGVAGCTALLVMGFGIRDSISGLSQRQFSEILHYEMLTVSQDELTADEKKENERLLSSDVINSYAMIHYEQLTAKTEANTLLINLIVPENLDNISDYLTLQNRLTGESLDLKTNEIILSEKLAKLLEAEVDDLITVKSSDNDEIDLRVSAITEMYIGHYIFMSPSAYESTFGETSKANANLIEVTDDSEETIYNLAAEFMSAPATLAVSMNFTAKSTVNAFLQGINSVMFVLLTCAILLAVVVIYNLTNINVSERIRELSTIKVLGFYDREVTFYIYRETIFLSLIGVVGGFFLGAYFHNLIITMLPTDDIMFNPELLWMNLAVSTLITMTTTLVLSVVVHYQLKHVDMLGALKSVD